LRKSISPPFDLHHLTHTQPRHFESLQEGSQNELITEFIAIRASQRPKDTLQGIRAECLRDGRNMVAQPRLTSTKGHANPVVVPSLNKPIPLEESSRISPRLFKSTRTLAVENFSRPAPQSAPSPVLTSTRHESWRSAYWPPLVGESRIENRETADRFEASNSRRCSRSTSDAVVVGSENSDMNDDISHRSSPRAENWPLPITSSNNLPDTLDAVADSTTAFIHQRPYSFSTRTIVPAHGHPNRSHHGQNSPGSISRSSQWEDDVDYSYENAAEADCNFDWDQKTFFVDEDSESVDSSKPEERCAAASGTIIDGLLQSVGNGKAKTGLATTCQSTLLDRRLLRLSCPSLNSLPDSERELRDCQRLSQASPQYHPKADARSAGLNSAPISGVWDSLSMGMPSVYEDESEDCQAGDSGSYDRSRTLLHKYSSDASTWSSPTSTILTSRSSGSVASVPELIHSTDSETDRKPADKAPSPSVDAVSAPSVEPRPPLHSTIRPRAGSQRSVGRHQQGLASGLCTSPRNSGGNMPIASLSIVPNQYGLPNGLVWDRNEEANKQSTTGSFKGRKRSATTGPSLAGPPSYSIFPSARPSTRLS
jgi:hypothetical protein